MHLRSQIRWFSALFAATSLGCALQGAVAAPILTEPPGNSIAAGVATAEGIDSDGDVLTDLLSSEFVLSGSRAEAFGSPVTVRVETERPTAGGKRATRAAPGSTAALPAGAEDGSDAVAELARSYLNVAPRGRATAAPGSSVGPGTGPAGGPPDPDRVEWLRDALLQVVGNTLQQHVNERGEITFSLLGFGEFSLMVSGDRSIVSLTQGDNVLLVADRRNTTDSRAAQSGEPMTDLNAAPLTPVGRSATVDPQPEASSGLIQRVLDIMIELLTHPIGMLFVAVVIGLGLIAKIFSARGRRRRGGRHRSRQRSPAPLETVPPPERSSRSRRRRSRGRSHGESESTQRA